MSIGYDVERDRYVLSANEGQDGHGRRRKLVRRPSGPWPTAVTVIDVPGLRAFVSAVFTARFAILGVTAGGGASHLLPGDLVVGSR
jgi:hypothetical protein